MNIDEIIKNLKAHPDYGKMGMIASHLGVVRGASLSGKKVTGIEVIFDQDAVNRIVRETNEMDGIVAVVVHTSRGRLNVGDEIMAVVVGGDTRDHVFPALVSAVNRIKAEAARKKEFF
ncbi:MAG: molybdenum cofactor biosynthesis protein MoaE [Deltaproteobacteria bacterium]|nr:molybdenum cofactor biosynthesis protein MoaE [Deltaproteobacteria bacterium]